jgi:hypothetical protein
VILVGVSLVVTGVVYPLIDLGRMTKHLDGFYQKAMLQVANELTANNADYLAGILLFYDKDQTLPQTKNLITPALMYLNTGDANLLPSLIASLNIFPATTATVLQDLKEYPVKIYLDNFRVAGLPQIIKSYLNAEYQHYWGNIYMYAPSVKAGRQHFSLKFSANYLVEGPASNRVVIDNQQRAQQALIYLHEGKHQSQAKLAYRLKLIPERVHIPADPLLQKSCVDCFLKGIIL